MLTKKPTKIPKYSMSIQQRLEEWRLIDYPFDVIFVEGHMLFLDEELNDMIDIKVFIDSDDDIRLARRIIRFDNIFKGNLPLLRDMLIHYEKVIKPFEEKNVVKQKQEADMVVPNYSFSPQVT